jgi:osmotically inducible protein OsmC
MAIAERTADCAWDGDLTHGSGTVSVHSGAFEPFPVTWASRTERSEGKTSPEELLAAAHGGCLTMSLASELTQAGLPPTQLDLTCRIVMDEVEGQGHQVVASQVELTASADGLDDDTLEEALAKADEGCPFSQLLRRAGVELHVSARLA